MDQLVYPRQSAILRFASMKVDLSKDSSTLVGVLEMLAETVAAIVRSVCVIVHRIDDSWQRLVDKMSTNL